MKLTNPDYTADMLPAAEVKKLPGTSTYSRWEGWVGLYNQGRYYSNSNPAADGVLAKGLESIEAQRSKIIEVHETNLPAMEHNKALAAEIAAFMEPRIPRIRNVYGKEPGSRKRDNYWYKETAGWVSDLYGVKCYDGFESAIKTLDDAVVTLNKLHAEEKAKEAKADQIKAGEAARIADIRKLGALAAKYGLPVDADVDTIRGAILDKDKYLCLAYYLERNRGDWTEGAHYASVGLDHFTVETPEDQEIYDCIRPLIDDFDDGRCFRDCKWNYGELYGKAAPELYQDLQEVPYVY